MQDNKPFKLQEITAMKLNCMKITQGHLEDSVKLGYEDEVVACNRELALLKYEAMNPQVVIDSIQSKLQVMI